MEKLHSLFIRHLRIIYDGEKTMARTFAAMSLVSHSKELERFFITRQVEKENMTKNLECIFALLKISVDGEADTIIRALADRQANDTRRDIQTAQDLLGSTIHIYLGSAYRTAISCARELDHEDAADLLRDCLRETTFHDEHLAFLEKEANRLQESGVIAA